MLHSVLQGSESCVEVVAEAMQRDDSLWKHYCEDFIWYKLHLSPEKTLFVQDILHLYIGSDLLDCTDALSKLVSLHVRLHVHQLDIAKVLKVLKPISKLESISSPLMPNPTTIFALKSVVSPEHTMDKKGLPNISSFIVTVLFEAFSEAGSKDELTQWHRSYLSIVCIHFTVVFNILHVVSLFPYFVYRFLYLHWKRTLLVVSLQQLNHN